MADWSSFELDLDNRNDTTKVPHPKSIRKKREAWAEGMRLRIWAGQRQRSNVTENGVRCAYMKIRSLAMNESIGLRGCSILDCLVHEQDQGQGDSDRTDSLNADLISHQLIKRRSVTDLWESKTHNSSIANWCPPTINKEDFNPVDTLFLTDENGEIPSWARQGMGPGRLGRMLF